MSFYFLMKFFADDSSYSLSQSTTAPSESPSAVEPVDSTSIIPSSSFMSHPPPLRHTSHVSQPSVLLLD